CACSTFTFLSSAFSVGEGGAADQAAAEEAATTRPIAIRTAPPFFMWFSPFAWPSREGGRLRIGSESRREPSAPSAVDLRSSAAYGATALAARAIRQMKRPSARHLLALPTACLAVGVACVSGGGGAVDGPSIDGLWR